MLKEIYYKLSSFFFKPQVASLGKNCKLRFSGRILGGSFVHLGSGVGIEKGFTIAVYPSFGGKVNPVSEGGDKGVWLGENGSYNRGLTIYCADSVYIGKNVLFGSNILVSDNEHGMDPSLDVPYYSQPVTAKPVFIGDGCWIAEGAKILSGTLIGRQSIVAAGAVVKGQFPERCILAGVPARIIRVWSEKEKSWVLP